MHIIINVDQRRNNRTHIYIRLDTAQKIYRHFSSISSYATTRGVVDPVLAHSTIIVIPVHCPTTYYTVSPPTMHYLRISYDARKGSQLYQAITSFLSCLTR